MPSRYVGRISTAVLVAGVCAMTAGALFAQGGTPETQQVVRPTQTVIQIDSASLVIGMGALGTGIGAGIRSAAGVMSKYMTARDGKDADRDKAHSEVLKALTDIVGRYHADRTSAAAGIEDINEDMEELRELVADFVGKPKPRKRQRRAAPQHLPTPPGGNDDTAAHPVSKN